MTIKEVGLSDAVLESLAQSFSRSPGEVKVCTFDLIVILIVCILMNYNVFLLFFSTEGKKNSLKTYC